MVCVNELQKLKCNKRAVLKDLAIVVSSYAPFITEELWSLMGEKGSVTHASFPELNASFCVEDSHIYPVSFNGKMRFKLELPVSMNKRRLRKLFCSMKMLKSSQTDKTLKK